MCLHNSIKEVRKFLKKNQHKDFVWLYKVVNSHDNVLGGIYQKYCYKPGINNSNSQRKNICYKHISIHRGIHVANLRRALYIHRYISFFKIIRVKCYIRDFLGTSGTEFVFKRIYIPKTEYKKALK